MHGWIDPQLRIKLGLAMLQRSVTHCVEPLHRMLCNSVQLSVAMNIRCSLKAYQNAWAS